MNKAIVATLVLLAAGLVAYLVLSPKPAVAPHDEGMLPSPVPSEASFDNQIDIISDGTFTGKALATNYYEFTQADFDRLQKSRSGVLLYFYANWCPTCRVQEPVIVDFMNSGGSNGKVALRVNYNDSDTEKPEEDLAKKYTIIYQHTFVVLDATGKEVGRANGQQRETALKALFEKI